MIPEPCHFITFTPAFLYDYIRMFGNIKKLLRNFNLKENNRPLIFLVCLMIATVLWLVNAMEKKYETTVSMPFQFTNFPQNKVLVNPPPKKLNVKLRAYGFTLLRHKFGLSLTPIILDVKLFPENSKDKNQSSNSYILTDKYISQISSQVSPEISIIDISPDTLFFQFDKLSEKRIKVTANLNISFQNQYFFSDSIRLSPSQIIIRGPSSIVDTITQIMTVDQKFSDLKSDVRQNISLQKIAQVEYSTYKINVEIPVSQYTEYSNKLALVKFHVPDSINLITFPGKIDIKCLVALNQFKNISPSSFIVGVDFNDVSNNSNYLPVKVFNQPGNILSLKFQPTTVEYIIKER
jgi:hypothetical protein